jgi:hypothetical protein
MVVTAALACGSTDRDRAAAAPVAARTAGDAVADDVREAVTRGGGYRVSWAPRPDPIPLNEPFELDVTVLSAADGTPVADASLVVEASMPSHGHGMLRHPRVMTRDAQGRYRVAGMLFHMSGHWVLGVTVVRKSVADTVEFDVELP